MQARELMRALDIESVLCLQDRTPLGRVEDVRIYLSVFCFASCTCACVTCHALPTLPLPAPASRRLALILCTQPQHSRRAGSCAAGLAWLLACLVG